MLGPYVILGAVKPGSWSSRGVIAAWTLYDFANSAFSAVIQSSVYGPYYAGAVVGNESGRGDLLWGALVSLSMIIVALSSPVLGGIADHGGFRKRFLATFTLVSVAATALMATVGPGMVTRGFVLGVVGIVGFEAAVVYYNAYLPDIAPSHLLGRVSAWGFAVGYAGSLVAFLVALPFALAGAYWACFLSAACLFGVFSVPAFIALPSDPAPRAPAAQAALRGVRETFGTLADLVHGEPFRHLRRFLIAYLVYEDGTNTVIYFSAVFASTTLGFSMADNIVLFAVVQVSALAGAAVWAKPTDTRGPKFVVMCTLVQWTIVTMAAYFVQTPFQFRILAIIAGTGLGAIQAASRALMATLIPVGREAELFGFYAFVGKSGAIFGPLVFGGVSAALGGNQRAAIIAIGGFFLTGLLLMRPVRPGVRQTPPRRAN